MKIRVFALRAAMLAFVALEAFAVGMYIAPSAMATHKCGQLLGSCIPHLGKTPKVRIQKPIIVKPWTPPVRVEPIRPAVLKCYETKWAYGQWVTVKPLREIPCK